MNRSSKNISKEKIRGLTTADKNAAVGIVKRYWRVCMILLAIIIGIIFIMISQIIGKTVIYSNKDGQTEETVITGGYLDIGIIDTMKDLIVNFIGAVVFSFIGYFYVKSRGEGRFARRFIPTMKFDELKEAEEKVAKKKEKKNQMVKLQWNGKMKTIWKKWLISS